MNSQWNMIQKIKKWYFVTRIALRKNCSSDREKLLKFEAEDQEFAKIDENNQNLN